MNKLLIIGNGGHARSCLDVIECQKKYKIAGIISEKLETDGVKLKYPIVGTDDNLNELINDYRYLFIGLGFIKSAKKRVSLYKKSKKIGFNFPIFKSRLSYSSESSSVDEGTIIMHHALINSNVSIGKNCIINTKALIEHDAFIGDNSHISTGAIVNGSVKIGKECFIGSNAVIREGIRISNNCIVSAGSFVDRNLEQGEFFNQR